MKKIIMSVIVSLLIITISTTTFAATIDTADGSESKDVTAKYVDSSTTPDVYHVDVEWDSMEFTYTITGTHSWDTENHEYIDDVTGVWTSDDNTVTVTNHSNKELTATVTFTNSTEDNISGVFRYVTNDTDTTDGVTLATAVGLDYEEADAFTANLTLSGSLSSTESTEFNKIGAITIQLS